MSSKVIINEFAKEKVSKASGSKEKKDTKGKAKKASIKDHFRTKPKGAVDAPKIAITKALPPPLIDSPSSDAPSLSYIPG